MAFDMSTLVTNRTLQDAQRVNELSIKGRNMTSVELAEWWGSETTLLADSDMYELLDSEGAVLLVVTKQGTGHKGAYNASDLNRVGQAILYVAGLYNQYGYNLVVNPKTDWSNTDSPTSSQMQEYLNDIQTIRNSVVAFPTTPDAPETMESIDWKTANNIEQIMVDIDRILPIIITTFIPCGEALCGGDNL